MFGSLLAIDGSVPPELSMRLVGPHQLLCPSCDRKLQPSWVNPSYRVRRRRRDAVATYDGYMIVSKRFKQTLEESGHLGAIFDPLPADPEYFSLRSSRILPFDAAALPTRFEDFCSTCGAYASVVGARPLRLLGIDAPLAPGLYRTDVEFACGIEQHPLIVVAPTTYLVLKGASLAGLEFRAIEA